MGKYKYSNNLPKIMYIYRKIINNETHYYLRISKRESGRVKTKDVAYLGKDPEKILEKLQKLNLKDIKKSMRTIQRTIDYERYINKAKGKHKHQQLLSEKPLLDVEAAKLHFADLQKKLDPQTLQDYFENFSFSLTWNSSSIEGNTISLDGATAYFTEKIMPTGAQETEVYDLRNGQKATMHILNNYKTISITHEFIKTLHQLLMADIDKRINYRTFDVRILGSTSKTTHHPYIHEDMTELLDWYNKQDLHPFIATCAFHIKFEQIHPFADGNGRTGRLLLILMLLQQDYPPLIVARRSRTEYLKVLAAAQKKEFLHESYKNVCDYFAHQLKKSYWHHFE